MDIPIDYLNTKFTGCEQAASALFHFHPADFQMLALRRVLVSFLLILLTVQPVAGWFEGGHNVTAVLAFDLLQPDEQNRILTLLKAHPRIAQDFVPPTGILDRPGLA